MNMLVLFNILEVVALIAVVFVGFQVRDRLDKVVDLLEKK